MTDLVGTRVEELVAILELQSESVRQIAFRTCGVGASRMNVPIERAQDRG